MSRPKKSLLARLPAADLPLPTLAEVLAGRAQLKAQGKKVPRQLKSRPALPGFGELYEARLSGRAKVQDSFLRVSERAGVQAKWKFCAVADKDHAGDARSYMHTYHRKGTVCVAKAAAKLATKNLDALFAHEFGHLVLPRGGTENAATKAGEKMTGKKMHYDKRGVQTNPYDLVIFGNPPARRPKATAKDFLAMARQAEAMGQTHAAAEYRRVAASMTRKKNPKKKARKNPIVMDVKPGQKLRMRDLPPRSQWTAEFRRAFDAAMRMRSSAFHPDGVVFTVVKAPPGAPQVGLVQGKSLDRIDYTAPNGTRYTHKGGDRGEGKSSKPPMVVYWPGANFVSLVGALTVQKGRGIVG